MFSLSPPEKKVLIAIAFIIFLGTTIRYFNLEVKNESIPQSDSKRFKVININQATSSELQKIPGLGPVLSRRVIEYRKAHSFFKTISDLEKVKGIGKKKVKIIAEYIEF
ncbi:MAG: helix-hairpin-helix domain-containing protein [Candidatus Omnitrophica bacterium]|nr:helix-hairpin-helix domain-containing protein [Candidatus Omnitrophota bacterium]MCF7879086.1 helix-hairpin-helix domain-containing protein [Candidatus Omnitrophota bacterium]MCF7892860.1 helix-hairpin-helix domain-containing protein [Candidatus Omnitrophota bacterium]